MKKNAKIMVALGFSDYAPEIFEFAAKQAGCMGAELFIASVISNRDIAAVGTVSAMGYEVNAEHYVRGIKAERRQMLEGILEKSSYPHDRIRLVFRIGHPIDELLKLIVEENVDIVIMGIKGRSDLESVLVGSLAEKMFRKSPVPVISYRDAKNASHLRKRIRTD